MNTALHLTKIEKFILSNPDMQLEDIARQLNKPYATIDNCCDRAIKKTKDLTPEDIQQLSTGSVPTRVTIV